MTAFTRNNKEINKESFSSGSIKTTGLHVGQFTKAYEKKSKSSESLALHLDFLSTRGEFGQIDIWHKGKDGNVLKHGIAQIQGLIALFGIDDLRPKKNDLVEMYDFDLKAVKEVRVDTYPQLLEKTIGTVWQTEEYLKQIRTEDGYYVDGDELKERTVFLCFCDAKSHQTAFEFIHDTPPEFIDNFVENLPEVKRLKLSAKKIEKVKDKKIEEKAKEFQDYDDDIPF